MANLEDLKTRYNELCQRIAPHPIEYSFLTEGEDTGAPHVEFSDGQFHHIVTERGLILEQRSTADIEEILYWLLYDLTFWMGVAYEFKNRIEDQDARRIIFAHQMELMRRADDAMTARLEAHIADTLAKNPFLSMVK